MEMIHLSGYTHHEKLEIARQFLIPKQLGKHGLGKYDITFDRESLRFLIERYTREAGVRNLERELASICRKLARRVLKNGLRRGTAIAVTPELTEELLGKPRYRGLRTETEAEVGAAVGLAWTQVGGELLTTEVSLMRGTGKLTLTGQLGDVMQESARAALSFVRSRAEDLGIDVERFEKTDIHLHVPEGAIPKDGPSAGITMAAALISAFADTPVRVDVAMTGEITLRGRVLPVGGVKEKVLAAYRAGIRRVVLPEENDKDLDEIPEEVRDAMTFILVTHMDEVLEQTLEAEAEGALSPVPSAAPEAVPPMAH